jgi:hypothetical protein
MNRNLYQKSWLKAICAWLVMTTVLCTATPIEEVAAVIDQRLKTALADTSKYCQSRIKFKWKDEELFVFKMNIVATQSDKFNFVAVASVEPIQRSPMYVIQSVNGMCGE